MQNAREQAGSRNRLIRQARESARDRFLPSRFPRDIVVPDIEPMIFPFAVRSHPTQNFNIVPPQIFCLGGSHVESKTNKAVEPFGGRAFEMLFAHVVNPIMIAIGVVITTAAITPPRFVPILSAGKFVKKRRAEMKIH